MSMRYKQHLPRSERGAAMLAALCLAMVFAIALSSYIALCYVSLSTSTRNVVNEHSLELAEAGIEQALYANNNNALTGWNVSTVGPTTTVSTQMTMTSLGLQPTSGGPTPLNYGNGATGIVNVSYSYPTAQPMQIQSIKAQGVMTLPSGTVTSGAGPTISRTLTYSAPNTASAMAPLFVNAVAATSGVLKFKTGGTVDSYNSNPSVGVYQDYSATVAGYSAVLLSGDIASASATVRLMDANVKGYAVGYDTSSPASTNWLSNGSTGKLVGPNTLPATFIDSSRILTSPVPYQPIFPEANPLPNWTVNLGNVNSSMTLGTANATSPTVYDINSITLSGNKQITIVGPVIFIMWGSISITSTNPFTAGIYLTTASASLQIFQQYGSIALGAFGITNTNSIATTGVPPLPKRVCVLTTYQSAGSMTISMTTPFYGVVYLPYMPITVSSNAVILGSLVGSAVSFTGAAPVIHYDNALRVPDINVRDAAFNNISAPITVNSLVASVP